MKLAVYLKLRKDLIRLSIHMREHEITVDEPIQEMIAKLDGELLHHLRTEQELNSGEADQLLWKLQDLSTVL